MRSSLEASFAAYSSPLDSMFLKTFRYWDADLVHMHNGLNESFFMRGDRTSVRSIRGSRVISELLCSLHCLLQHLRLLFGCGGHVLGGYEVKLRYFARLHTEEGGEPSTLTLHLLQPEAREGTLASSAPSAVRYVPALSFTNSRSSSRVRGPS